MARFSITRLGAMVGCLALSGLMTGCFGSNQVAFTNVSDSWLNVRFFVANPDAKPTAGDSTPGDPSAFIAQGKLQVQPGETAKYKLSRNPNYSGQGDSKIVHIQVEPVTPSWQPSGTEYWLELLTPPPVTIVATGTGPQLIFNSGTGALAQIPEHQIKSGAFDHRVVTVTESPNPASH